MAFKIQDAEAIAQVDQRVLPDVHGILPGALRQCARGQFHGYVGRDLSIMVPVVHPDLLDLDVVRYRHTEPQVLVRAHDLRCEVLDDSGGVGYQVLHPEDESVRHTLMGLHKDPAGGGQARLFGPACRQYPPLVVQDYPLDYDLVDPPGAGVLYLIVEQRREDKIGSGRVHNCEEGVHRAPAPVIGQCIWRHGKVLAICGACYVDEPLLVDADGCGLVAARTSEEGREDHIGTRGLELDDEPLGPVLRDVVGLAEGSLRRGECGVICPPHHDRSVVAIHAYAIGDIHSSPPNVRGEDQVGEVRP